MCRVFDMKIHPSSRHRRLELVSSREKPGRTKLKQQSANHCAGRGLLLAVEHVVLSSAGVMKAIRDCVFDIRKGRGQRHLGPNGRRQDLNVNVITEFIIRRTGTIT